MQVETTHRPTVGSAGRRRPIRRLLDRVADACSPMLQCEACGCEVRQRRCRKTGVSHPVPEGAGWSRWSGSETEYLCPECGASIWVLETPMVYPVF